MPGETQPSGNPQGCLTRAACNASMLILRATKRDIKRKGLSAESNLELPVLMKMENTNFSVSCSIFSTGYKLQTHNIG